MASTGMDALLDGVRDHLRSELTLTALECDVCPDGKPNPDSGQRFVSIHSGSVQSQSRQCLDEMYSWKVTVTVRTSQDPRDRKRDGGAWALALRVRAAIHMNADLVAAVAVIDDAFVVTEFPMFNSGNYLGPQGPDWFWAEGRDADPTGIAVELTFSKVRRIQYIEEQE